ncbi:MAG: alpha/beta fold hydrolase [Promethearchaeota archaeon]
MKENNSTDAIIFIHGSGGSSIIWENQFYLNVNCDIITLDLPSHDNSDLFLELSLDLYVDVVKKFIDSRSYKRVIICGHSLGGAIAQSFYFKHPKNVNILVLVGTGARLRVDPFILDTLKNNFPEYLDSMPAIAFYRKTSKEIINPLVNKVSQINNMVVYNDFKICDSFDTMKKTHTIKIPCLIICGNADKLTPVKYSQFFNNQIKNSELKIIKDAAHMVMLEKPAEFNEIVENYLENYL